MTAPEQGPRSLSGPLRWSLLVVVGLVGGFLSGLFGVGGGIVMVPLLVTFVRLDQRRAAATSLAAIIPAALAGSISYGVSGQVEWLAAALVAVGGIAGSQLGSRLLRRLPVRWLRVLFIVLLMAVAVRMLVQLPARDGAIDIDWVSGSGLVALGLSMGIASGLFGIGGGVIAVPVLIAVFGASDLLARGTSLAAMVPLSLSGSIANGRAGLIRPLDGIVLGLAAVIASFPGVAVAFLLDPAVASVLFVTLMAVPAAQLLLAGLRARRRP